MQKGTNFNAIDYAKNMRTFDVQETLRLLQSYGFKFWSWGAQAFKNFEHKALRMKVNGHHHKGHVYIFLNGSDLYNVILTSVKGTFIEEITDLYFDQLFDTIDEKIEKIPAYKD
jgi:hypothetical protein